jgi:hypothetical protein
MGNTQASTEIAQANSPLVRLVEDVFVVLLRNFKLRDFISLMSTCKLFYYYRLAPVSYFRIFTSFFYLIITSLCRIIIFGLNFVPKLPAV